MSEKHSLSSGQLLLLELIFAVGFFCFSAAVTMSIFGKAYVLSENSAAKERAAIEADAVSDTIRSVYDEAEINELLVKLGFECKSDGSYEKLFEDGKYRMVIVPSVEKRLYKAEIKSFVTSNSDETSNMEPVFSMEVLHALKNGGKKDG